MIPTFVNKNTTGTMPDCWVVNPVAVEPVQEMRNEETERCFLANGSDRRRDHRVRHMGARVSRAGDEPTGKTKGEKSEVVRVHASERGFTKGERRELGVRQAKTYGSLAGGIRKRQRGPSGAFTIPTAAFGMARMDTIEKAKE